MSEEPTPQNQALNYLITRSMKSSKAVEPTVLGFLSLNPEQQVVLWEDALDAAKIAEVAARQDERRKIIDGAGDKATDYKIGFEMEDRENQIRDKAKAELLAKLMSDKSVYEILKAIWGVPDLMYGAYTENEMKRNQDQRYSAVREAIKKAGERNV